MQTPIFNAGIQFPSVEADTRTHVDTNCAAYWLNRKPQTLRMWATFEKGPVRPIRVNGRLAWSVDDIRKVLGKAVM
ncbi:DNA-binding protein [Massilia sp. YMA4]|uniref:DNA-binding protein n=1 Tax=Massilia sp. YMA4 TaxID=1593482 RepID=UPI000DD0F059|nr:DNA-binding protein [Massilia sp. YMA4]AXA94153.1 DNA-binding protein [Massilia sp. YMA4]